MEKVDLWTQRIDGLLRYCNEDNFVANATYEDSLNLFTLIPYNYPTHESPHI